MSDFENKYDRMISAFALLARYKKFSRERRDDLKKIVLEYLAQLEDDELDELIEKAQKNGERNPDFCDQIIFALLSVLNDLVFGEIIKIIEKFERPPAKQEGFQPKPKYKISGDNYN